MKSLFAGVLMIAAVAAAGAEPSPESVFRLAQPEFPARSFEGTIDYARSAVISFEAKGRLTFVAPLGTYVKSEVLTLTGGVAVPGDLLAAQDPDIPESDVQIAEEMLKRTDTVLHDRLRNYTRDKMLTEKEAVSVRQYEETQTQRDTALIDKRRAELDLQRARQVLDACFVRAPFNAVVTEIFRSEGGAVDVGNPVLKISMIDPVLVKIPIPPEARRQVVGATRVWIYPAGSDQPVGGWLEGPELIADTLECYADNPRSARPVYAPDGTLIPSIDELSAVQEIPEKSKVAEVWVAIDAVRHDAEGYYVWKLRDKAPDTGDGKQPDLNTLEKVRVVPLNRQIQYGTMILRGIEAGSGLKNNDVIASDVPDGVKPGETVIYRRKQHLFQVGGKVRVIFSGGYGGYAFTVPAKALRKNAKNVGFHVRNGSREIPVTVVDREGDNARIYAPELQPGMEIAL